MRLGWLGLVCGLAWPGAAWAGLKMPALFSDHMVMQAGQATPVWGEAEAGEVITVTLVDEKGVAQGSASGAADEKGAWRVKLPVLTAGVAGRLLVEEAKSGKKEIADVVVGEVWLGGGQSNMSYRVGSTGVAAETLVEASEEAKVAQGAIRYFMTDTADTDEPQRDVPGKWVVAAPENVKKCSAVAWYFGVALHEKLKVPVGLIVSAYAGTPVEAWMPKEALDGTSVATALRKRHEAAMAKVLNQAGTKPGAGGDDEVAAGAQGGTLRDALLKREPNRLYNGMVAGLGDYAIKGVIWFQADGNIAVPEEYGELIQALIKAWRKQWGTELPFYYVEMNDMHEPQSAAWEPKREAMARIREQQGAALKLPKTAVVAAIDLGKVNNPTANAHFPVKKPVGDRLANVAFKEVYGIPMGEIYSPEYTGYVVEGDKVRLHFAHAEGLRAVGEGEVKGFILQNEKGAWVWAEGKIEGTDIVVWSAEAPKPRDVRYAWASNPVTSIENGAGLPLRPFRATLEGDGR